MLCTCFRPNRCAHVSAETIMHHCGDAFVSPRRIVRVTAVTWQTRQNNPGQTHYNFFQLKYPVYIFYLTWLSHANLAKRVRRPKGLKAISQNHTSLSLVCSRPDGKRERWQVCFVRLSRPKGSVATLCQDDNIADVLYSLGRINNIVKRLQIDTAIGLLWCCHCHCHPKNELFSPCKWWICGYCFRMNVFFY